MTKLFQNKYTDIILWLIISFIGMFVYNWNINQVLFFVYLHQLLKIPGILIVGYRLNNKKVKEFTAFSIIIMVVFGIYTLFFTLLMYTYRPRRHDDSWINAFLAPTEDLYENFGLTLIALLVVEILGYIYKHRKTKPNLENANKLFVRVSLHYAIYVLPLIICGALSSKEFHLEKNYIAISILLIFGLTEFFIVRSQRGNFAKEQAK